jgi:hypothetical protein
MGPAPTQAKCVFEPTGFAYSEVLSRTLTLTRPDVVGHT